MVVAKSALDLQGSFPVGVKVGLGLPCLACLCLFLIPNSGKVGQAKLALPFPMEDLILGFSRAGEALTQSQRGCARWASWSGRVEQEQTWCGLGLGKQKLLEKPQGECLSLTEGGNWEGLSPELKGLQANMMPQ